MGKRLDKLTPNQLALLPTVRDKWLEIGLRTGPTDWGAADAAIGQVYECAGLSKPSFIIHLNSPFHGAIGSAMLRWGQVGEKVGEQVREQVREQVWRQVVEQVGEQVRWQVKVQVEAQVGEQVVEQVVEQVWRQVWNQVLEQVEGQVEGQVGEQVVEQVEAQVGGQVGEQVGEGAWGTHEAPWCAFYDYFQTIVTPDVSFKCIQGLLAAAQTCGWWWPFQNVCIITPIPTTLKRDEDNLLHCETGPALDYNGAWGIWAWHGVRVPQQVIEAPETLDPKQVLSESNIEVRRVMVERIGMERLFTALNPQELDADHDGAGQPRRLLTIDMPQDPDRHVKVVHVHDPSTHREYFLRVPPAIRTCAEAVAWTFGVNVKKYVPLVEA